MARWTEDKLRAVDAVGSFCLFLFLGSALGTLVMVSMGNWMTWLFAGLLFASLIGFHWANTAALKAHLDQLEAFISKQCDERAKRLEERNGRM